MATRADDGVEALARRIAAFTEDEQSRVYHLSWWSDRLLERAMANPSFKTELFRFVDVFPATRGPGDVHRHLEEYFHDGRAPKTLGWGLDLAGQVPLGERVAASVARRNVLRMAHQFIVGVGPADAVPALRAAWERGSAFTCDVLGEKTVTDGEADDYGRRVTDLLDALLDDAPHWPSRPHLEHDDLGALPRVNISVKPTALSPRFQPLTASDGLAEVKERLRPLLRVARERGAFVHLDMEHYDVKDLTLQLFRELLEEEEFTSLDAGVVVQAYLRDSYRDLRDLVAWSARRATPVTVRLVKGAYWDTETVIAGLENWPSPVFEHKHQTDANYERCVRLLHDNHGAVRAAFGTHNLRSLAYAVTAARERGIPDDGYEIQMLHGMAEPLHAAVRRLGLRLRVYSPVGELVPGMAYLVRRLLENTSNESFVRLRFAEGRDLDELLEPPADGELPEPDPPAPLRPRPPTDATDPSPYLPEPHAEWRRAPARAAMAAAVEAVTAEPPREVPAVISGREVWTDDTIESVDPAQPARRVATSASCTIAEADDALACARAAQEGWRATPAVERARVVFDAAHWLRERRFRIAALEVLEAGKPWAEADADVCEAIDFCEYYGREMLRLARGGRVQSAAGEHNRLLYQGKGVAVVISPWNFPLAIPTGMVTAALVAGNAVLFKPAEQTPAIAAVLVDALRAAGVPADVLSFLPGVGEEVGAHLVAHPDVAVVSFTGSMAVGLEINRVAAVPSPGQRQVKRVVAEMGGKNAIVVDADADLDVAVPAIVSSAFGYAGQKCSAASRLVVLDDVADDLLERLVGATRALRVGHPRDPAVQVGPVIDGEAYTKVRGYVERAHQEGTVLLIRDDVPDDGYFVGPVVVGDVARDSSVACEEIFGPVLTVFRAADFDEALAIANDTPYGLTAGVISRSPANLRRAARELRAGNVYLNQGITGSIVGRHPFGGIGLSGVGSKAGGPDYLLQFLDPRAVSENTLRQGFAPLEESV